MSGTPQELHADADKRRLAVILAEVELAITLQRVYLLEHSLGNLESSRIAHRSAVESLGRARYLLAPVPAGGQEMWQTLGHKIGEIEELLRHRPA